MATTPAPGTPMRRRTKRVLLALGIAAALVAALLVAAPLFVDADSFRPALEKLARERLGRDVTMGELGVSFTPPSLTIDDLRIAGAPGGPAWLESKAVRVRASWSGLIGGRLEVQGIAADEPSIRLLRSPDGRWNLVELLGERKEAKSREGLPLDTLRVRGGSIEIVDAAIVPGSVTRLQWRDVDASVSGLSADAGLDVEVSGTLEGAGRAGFAGRFGPGNALAGKVTLEDLLLAPLAPYLASRTGFAAIDGRLSCELDVDRADGQASAKGHVAIRAFRLPTATKGAAPVDADAEVDVRVDGGGGIEVRRFDVDSGATSVRARGSVADSPGEQVVTLDVEAPKLSIADVAALAAAAGQPFPFNVPPAPLSASGKARIVRKGEPRVLASVVLDGVTVRGGAATFRKESDGDWHLVGSATAPARKRNGADIRLRNLRIDGASVRLEDATVSPVSVVDISDVQARIESWAPGEPGQIDIGAKVAGGTFSLKGRVAAPGAEGASSAASDLRLSAQGIDLARAGALTSALGLAPRAGRADWNAQITGRAGSNLAAKGRLDLKGAVLPLPSGREVTLNLPIEHDVQFLGDGRVKLARLALGLPGTLLELDGRIQAGEALRYDIGTKGVARLSPEAVAWLVALSGRALPLDIELFEPIDIDARARNGGAGLELSGRADVRKARVRHPLLAQPLEVARATLDLQGDRIDVSDASLRLGASVLEGRLTLEDFAQPRLAFDLSAPQANLDELFAVAAGARGARGDSTPAPGPALATRMRAQGRLRVGQATFGGLAFSSFESSVDLREGRLLFDPASVALYGGRGTGTLALDLSAPRARYDADIALDGVDVRALLEAGVGYRDLSGRGSLTARLQGEAGNMQETLRGVRGGGTMRLVDGEIGKLNALKALERASVFGERSLSALGSRLARDGTPFSSLDGEFSLGDGRMTIARSRLITPDADTRATGAVQLVEKRLDLDAVLVFAAELSEQMRLEGSRAAQVFWDERRQQVVLPTRLTGTLAAPQATIDWSAAMSQVLQRQRDAALGSILGGGRDRDDPSGATGASGPSGSAGGGVEDLLGSILGRRPRAGQATGATGPAGASGKSTVPSERSSGRGAPAIRVDQARMGGNFLMPDLRLRATLSGSRLSHAILVVESPDGREIAREDRAFEQQVSEHYVAAPRDEAADIAVRATIDFKRLGGSGPFVVRLRPVDDRGREGDWIRAEVAAGASPF